MDWSTVVITIITLASGFLLGVVGKAIEHRFFSKSVGEDAAFEMFQERYFALLSSMQKLQGKIMSEALEVTHAIAAATVALGARTLEDLPNSLGEYAERQLSYVDTTADDGGHMELKAVVSASQARFDECADEFRKVAYEFEIYLPEDVAAKLWKFNDAMIAFRDATLDSSVGATIAMVDAHKAAVAAVLEQLASVNARKKSVSELICRK